MNAAFNLTAVRLCVLTHLAGLNPINTYPVGSVNIMTDEGANSIDTLFKDVIVTPLDRNNWADSLKYPHITSLQFADDFSSDWSGCSMAVPET